MHHLPYELSFMHRFNMHKWLGLIMDDYDLKAIARIYGVRPGMLKKIEDGLNRDIAASVEKLKQKVPVKAAPQSPYTMLAYSDSLTSDRKSWAKILNRYWGEAGGRKIVDCAISGDTTSNLINRFYRTALKEAFDRAIIFIGINDARQMDDGSRITNISPEEYKRNLEYIVKTFLRRTRNIIMITLPYVDNERLKKQFPDANWMYDRSRIDRSNEAIREFTRKYKLTLVDLSRKLREMKEDPIEYDGIHLNDAAHLVLCEMLLQVLP